MGLIRIGKINFTNVYPVFYFFRSERFPGEVELIPQVPAQLNKKMAEGTIDMGFISSFEYARNHQQYKVMPGLSISSLGKVRSVFLFSKKPLEELKEAKICLTNMSATSINLLKIILEKFNGLSPQYETMESNFAKMMELGDGCLLIGDDALVASMNNPGYYIYDLGELWYRYTGFMMIFSVWTIRRDAIAAMPDLVGRIYEELMYSKEMGRTHLNEIIQVVCRKFGGNEDFWKQYYTGLSYDFTEEHKRGLEYYYRCAAELGLLPEPVEVKVWDGAKYKYS